MTEDRDFKRVVRKRSAKTGESYQAARRQLQHQSARLSALVTALWAHPTGLVLGCTVDDGQIAVGMTVTVMAGGTTVHQGTVASLRVGKRDQAVVTSGNCGITLEPPFHGYVPRHVDPAAVEAGALRPVEVLPLPYTVIGSGGS